MGTLEERVGHLESQVAQHAQMFGVIRDSLAAVDRRLDRLEQRLDARFDAVDRRFDAIDRRFDAVDRRFEGVDTRQVGLEDKMSRQFLWTVGIQVTILVAVLGAVLTRG